MDSYVIQILLNGLLLGGIYAVVALGFSLVWGIMNIINLAHGSFIMLGAFVTYTLFATIKLDPFLAIPVVAGIIGLGGWLFCKYLLSLVLRAPLHMLLIMTYGFAIVLMNLALRIWSPNYRTIETLYAAKTLWWGQIYVPYHKLLIFALAVALVGLTDLFLNRTKTGMAIRATRMNLEAAQLMGVNIGNIYAITFGLSAALAGVAGTLVSLTVPITPVMGDFYLGIAFIVCIIGGLGNTKGALVGGLAIGILETIVTAVFGISYRVVLTYLVLLVILVVRPQGLFGKKYY